MLGGCITVYGLYSMGFLVRRCNICGIGGGDYVFWVVVQSHVMVWYC